MPRILTAADRSALIRLAGTLPVGSSERKAVLAGLREAKLEDIPKAAQDFERAMSDLKKAAGRLKRLFKQHPVQGDDWGRGEAAEELVTDTLAAIKKLGRNPIVMGLYAENIPGMSRIASDRSALIRLAGTLPAGSDERKAILAGLKEAKKALLPGTTLEVGPVRYHRYMDSLRVTDLTNAGKRGKKVDQFIMYNLDYMRGNQIAQAQFEKWLAGMISKSREWRQVRMSAVALLAGYEKSDMYPIPKMDVRTLRGVDVDPSEKIAPRIRETVVDTPERTLSLDVKPSRTSIREVTFFTDKGKRGPYKTDRMILNDGGGRKAKKLYQWVVNNQDLIRDSLRRDNGLQGVRKMLNSERIPYDMFYSD